MISPLYRILCAGTFLLVAAPLTALRAQSAQSAGWVEVPDRAVREVLGHPFEGACSEDGLPIIEGLPRGDVRVRLAKAKLAVDSIGDRASATGILVDPSSETPLLGIRMAVGTIAEERGKCRFVVQTGTMTREDGTFELSWNIRPGQVLIASMLGRLEAVWMVGGFSEYGGTERRKR
jgi:hypothetical protein